MYDLNHFTIFPDSFNLAEPFFHVNTLAIYVIVLELTVVFGSISPSHHPMAMLDSVLVLTLVHRLIYEELFPLAMLQAVFPLTLVLSTLL